MNSPNPYSFKTPEEENRDKQENPEKQSAAQLAESLRTGLNPGALKEELLTGVFTSFFDRKAALDSLVLPKVSKEIEE